MGAWAIGLLIDVLNTNKVGLNVLHKYVKVSSNCLINLEQGILTTHNGWNYRIHLGTTEGSIPPVNPSNSQSPRNQ